MIIDREKLAQDIVLKGPRAVQPLIERITEIEKERDELRKAKREYREDYLLGKQVAKELKQEVERLNGLLKEFVWAEGDEGHGIVEGMEQEIQQLRAALERIDKTSLGCKCGEVAGQALRGGE